MDEEDLDWGDTEIPQGGHLGPADDADDGVSLGSESGDEGNNTAVPVTATAASTSGAASRVTQSNGALGSRSPKSSNFPPRESLPRETSSTPIKRNDQSSIASPKPKSRRSKSTSVSAPKVIHGLPPKPVVANVPLLPPSHPSLTEATKMSEAAKGKPTSNSSTNQPSQDVDAPLPPDWQIRHPRSGGTAVYYYNTRTHQCTWQRPSLYSHQDPATTSSSRTSNKAESVEPDTSRNALSYDDRHYRPGAGNASDNDAPPSHATRRGRTTDTWFGNATEGRRDQSHSPPRGRNRSRSLSPPRRSRERGGRRRRSSRQKNANGDRDRESSLVQENDRHRHAPMEGGAASTAPASHKSRKSQRSVQEPQDHLDESHPSHNIYPEREKSDSPHSTLIRLMHSPPFTPMGFRTISAIADVLPRALASRFWTVMSSFREALLRSLYPALFYFPASFCVRLQDAHHGLLLSSPHLLLQSCIPISIQEPQEPQSSSTAVNSGKRDRPSRFALPAAPAAAKPSRNQDDDAWVPDEFKAPAASPSADRHAHPEQRESREGRQTTADTRNMYSARNDEPTSPSLSSGPTSEQPSSRRKRPPLPPQSMRFRESKSNGRSSHSVPAVTAEASDAAHRSPQASNHVSLSPQSALPALSPSVPRAHGERGTLVRDLPPHQRSSKFSTHDVPSHYDQPRDGRHERERERERGDRDRERPREPREEARERGRERERVRERERERRDTSPAGSSSRPPRHRSPSRSRSPSPGRRSVSAEPSIRAGSGMYADNMAVDDPPPRAPRSMVPPSPVKNMYPSRPVRQSPPPASLSHRTDEGRERERERDLPEPPARDGPRSRKDEVLDSKIPGGPRARGRGRGGRGLPLSGTNNIPVGTRHAVDQGPPKAPQNHYALPPPVLPSKLSGANTIPVKEARTRGYNANHEPSDHVEPSSRSYSNSKDYPPSESEISRHAPNAREREDDGHRGSTRSRRRSLSIDEPRQRPHTDDEPRSSRPYRSPSPRARHYNGIDEPRSTARASASRDDQRGRSSDDGRPSNHRSARSPISPVSRRQEEDYPPRDRDRESRGRDGRTEPQRSPERRQLASSASSPPLKLSLTSIPVPPPNAGLPMKPVPYNPPPSPRPSGRVYPASEAEKRRKLEEEKEREQEWERERDREREREERERKREGEREREREGERQRQRQREREDEQMSRPPPDGRSQRPPIKLRRPPPPATPEPMDIDRTPAERPPLPTVSTGSGSGGSGLAGDRDGDRDRDRPRDRRPSTSRQGASLLDRLGGVDGGQKLPDPPVSLRDRVTVPSKRDRDDMGLDDRYRGDVDDIPVGDESSSKRAKKRHGRLRRRGGRGPGGGPYP
ncbi:hypothetical protein D9758_008274 [Tetrapyrgos nigripes]|uniref:WW domain-containing protein n=1 Tax=Tetrapyrgos nigripes TaxID=182062 RepID=A0A8H5LFB9_9AGAR|nr:hypothetical protein D9758_008274 [Tetrapyrgos nigripes]